jgi:hypothetical protein
MRSISHQIFRHGFPIIFKEKIVEYVMALQEQLGEIHFLSPKMHLRGYLMIYWEQVGRI